MVSFNNISKHRTTLDTVKYEFYGVNADGTVSYLIVAPATQTNKSYTNEFLKRSAAITRRTRTMSAVTTEQLDALREIDRELFARHVVRGWENVQSDTGKAAPFNYDNCLSFLQAVPAEDIDELRNFCANHHNFSELKTGDTAKN